MSVLQSLEGTHFSAEGMAQVSAETSCDMRPLDRAIPADVGFVVSRMEDRCSEYRIVLVFRGKVPQGAVAVFHWLGRDRTSPPVDRKGAPLESAECCIQGIDRPQIGDSWELERIEQALGGPGFTYGIADMQLPPQKSAIVFCGLSLAWFGGSRDPQFYYCERRRCDWGLGTTPKTAYGFLFTPGQHAYLMEEITGLARREGIMAPPYDETNSDALLKIYFSLLGGFDTPMLNAIDSPDAPRQIQAMKNYAAMQLDRQRRTRFGLASKKRKVVELVDEGNSVDDPLASSILRALLSRGPDLLRAQIRDFTSSPPSRKFLEGVILNAKPLERAAECLKIPLAEADALLDRAALFLIFC